MIQFALLFGLGFLTAALCIMLIAPAVHGRIVRYTENRLKATLPISPQEVRAQRDMARAVYAAENAKTKQELVEERDNNLSMRLHNERLADDARRLQSQNHELQMQVNDMDVETADLRSRLRQEDSYIQQLKAAVEAAEEADASKGNEIDGLQRRLLRLTADVDNLRIDLSARDTEIENHKFRIASLRDEREAIRHDIKLQTTRAKDAEARLEKEEHRSRRLEDKLAREIADRADKENALERRIQEIARLKEKLRLANGDTRATPRSGRKGRKLADTQDRNGGKVSEPFADAGAALSTIAEKIAASPELQAMADAAHSDAMSLSKRLLQSDLDESDETIREELASIAAAMIALTAKAEGTQSPIHAILTDRQTVTSGDRTSLAQRAIQKI